MVEEQGGIGLELLRAGPGRSRKALQHLLFTISGTQFLAYDSQGTRCEKNQDLVLLRSLSLIVWNVPKNTTILKTTSRFMNYGHPNVVDHILTLVPQIIASELPKMVVNIQWNSKKAKEEGKKKKQWWEDKKNMVKPIN